ncbi:MAG: hypothetical protein WA919_04245 [Coleofasciculaceae cyanobacterium]
MTKIKTKTIITLTASLLFALIGCGEASTTANEDAPVTGSPAVEKTTSPAEDVSNPSESPTTSAPHSAIVSEDHKITEGSIGQAKLGMTLGELKEMLGEEAEFKKVSPFIVDFDAIAVSKGDEVQYYILYPAETTFQDSDVIEILSTDNPTYLTAQGVGAGTTLEQAEATYGDATLSFNYANESREYVKFANLSQDINFRLGAANDNSFSGIYSSPTDEYNETKEYRDPATIRSVEIYCREQCPLAEN